MYFSCAGSGGTLPWQAHSQDPFSEAEPPLDIESAGSGFPGQGEAVLLRLTNRSDKPVMGFSLIAHDGSGKPGAVRKQTAIRLPGEPGHPPYQPGESWTVSFRVLGASSVELDYVLFADGSGWGPDRGNAARRL